MDNDNSVQTFKIANRLDDILDVLETIEQQLHRIDLSLISIVDALGRMRATQLKLDALLMLPPEKEDPNRV